MSDFGMSALISGIAATAAAGTSATAGAFTGKKAQKRAHQYELENMEKQNQYQRGLMIDSPSMLKEGLQNAGYSAADPNGTGVTAPSQASAGTSATLGYPNFPDLASPFADTISALADARNSNADARLKEIEESYRARLLEGQIGEYNAKIKQIQDTLPETIKQIQADIELKRTQKVLTDKQADQAQADTERLRAITAGVKIDNQFKPDLNQKQVSKLEKEIYKLSQEGKIMEVHAKLASMGILVGADDLTQLAAIVTQGKAPELLQAIGDSFAATIGKLPEVIGQMFTSLFDGLVNGVYDKVKGIFPWNKK